MNTIACEHAQREHFSRPMLILPNYLFDMNPKLNDAELAVYTVSVERRSQLASHAVFISSRIQVKAVPV